MPENEIYSELNVHFPCVHMDLHACGKLVMTCQCLVLITCSNMRHRNAACNFTAAVNSLLIVIEVSYEN